MGTFDAVGGPGQGNMTLPLQFDHVPRRVRFRGFPRHRSYAAFVASHHPRILLADDDDEMRILVASRLQQDGFQVTAVPDGLRLEELLRDTHFSTGHREAFDVIISDVRMPGRSGLDALAELRADAFNTPFIVITGFADLASRTEALRLGASAVFPKPLDLDDLCMAVAHLVGA
jgi:CheY-like chemotaxis protein